MRRTIAWAVLALTGIYLVTAGGTYPAIASVQAAIVIQMMAVAILGGWLVLAILRPSWRPTTPLMVPVGIVVAAWCLSALFSQRPRLSLEPTLAGLGFAFAFLFLTRLLADPWFRQRAASLMILGTVLVSCGYIVQVVALWIEWWALVGRVALPPLRPAFASLVLGSPNLVATYLMLTGPLAIVLVAERSSRRWASIGLALVAATAIFLTGSRSAYLGAGFGVLTGLGLAASKFDLRRVPVVATTMIRGRPVLLVPIGALVGAMLVLLPVVARRFAQGGDSLRLDLWRSALTIFAEHPLTGGGPGTWVQLKVAANPPGSPNIILEHAHDLYVQAAAELGIVGLIALGILVAWVVSRLLLGWRSPRGLSLEAGAVLIGLTAFAGQSLVDNPTNLPSMIIPVLIVVAWIDGGLASPGLDAGARTRFMDIVLRSRPIVLSIVLVVLVLTVPMLIRIDRAGLTNIAGNDAALARDWPAALARYEAALADDPGHTMYQLERAGMLARVGRAAEARTQEAEAITDDPVGINVMSLAVLDLAVGDHAGAIDRARRALALGPFDPVLALNAGIIAELTGDRASALEAFANAIAWDPPLARSPFWSDPARTTPKADVIAAAGARSDPATAAIIVAYGGDPAAALAQIQTFSSGNVSDIDLAATQWLMGESGGAMARLADVVDRDPQDWFAAGWLARIARQSGDVATADRYARWATIVEADAADSAIFESSVVPADPDDPSAGLPANYPWGVYLRPIPPFLTPPQLVAIGTR
jgi:O-antigen ligase/tetratricopeptide (TPR) repeat protein